LDVGCSLAAERRPSDELYAAFGDQPEASPRRSVAIPRRREYSISASTLDISHPEDRLAVFRAVAPELLEEVLSPDVTEDLHAANPLHPAEAHLG
jgi:hypothetical protein